MNINRQSDIIWVDSDPNIRYRTSLLQAQGYHVACFNETIDALNALSDGRLEPNNIKCVITSMMKRGGRREKGFFNGLEMLDKMKIIWGKAKISCKPLIAVISLTADIQKCKEHGVDIIVLGDDVDLQAQVIDELSKRFNKADHGR